MTLEQQRRLVDELLAQERDEDGCELTEEAKENHLKTVGFYCDSHELQQAIRNLYHMEKDALKELKR